MRKAGKKPGKQPGKKPGKKPGGARRPIVDTHIHFYEVSRPGGVPWPAPDQKALYRDVLPAAYEALARRHGIVGSGIVEASPDDADNRWILDLVKGDRFFPFFVAQVDLGAKGFRARLEALAADRRVVGVRGFLWAPTLTLDARQLANLRALAARGMTLDLISRGTLNPKEQVSALAAAVPELRVVIDHLGGAKGREPAVEWELAMRRLADRHPNVHVKLSSFFDMYGPGDEKEPWKAPTELSAYEAHFDVLMTAFGPDRLMFGTNWPVCELGGGFGAQIAIAERYLARFGTAVRDKVMFGTARRFYRRRPPRAAAASRGGRSAPRSSGSGR
jgi:predicted TIM-barrel fold metal-dependent hydrolase